ncbi:Protein TusC [Candidatus Erwinia haradaeae]|uniref:Protein TusC n=1 Tax=Candidatus Erwinia haradaeae TaxID=1922217 RepID=A0A451DCJ7_9GAMM|nr:sulfurtransferase complex subunit TusC [Candidatus Erwinia haradaeae]VFP84166.1 Protein TusC [Candidatus Erwinia haradaeae]
MHSIAFVFTKSPHGSSAGREGLDAVLATLTLRNNVGLFFLSDGALQLIRDQSSDVILTRNYSLTFSVLPLYDARQFYVCSESLLERGIPYDHKFILPVKVLSSEELRVILHKYDRVMTF